MLEQTSTTFVVAVDKDYGVWMLVEQRSRCETLDGIKKETILKGRKLWDHDFNRRCVGGQKSFSSCVQKEQHPVSEEIGCSGCLTEIKLPREILKGRNVNAKVTGSKGGWDKSHRVEPVGFFGNIWIRWKNSIDLENLYGENPGPLGFLPPNAFPSLSPEYVDFLGKSVTNEEIRIALFDMVLLKATGSDGFQATFFQNQWDNTVRVICEWVKKSAYCMLKEESWYPKDVNWSIVWKIPRPRRVEHFIWLVLKQRFLTNSKKARRVVITELWGILDGLLLLQKQGYIEVIIQSDNLENVISICESKFDGPKSSLIRRIQQILAFEKKWSLNYVPRESNLVTDALVKMTLMRDETLHV
ncbi:hypothetical protein PVK06_024772 [Gossypium arboreum]|uniref:RNase H type-1 domain-containing protein n=1 Tax=Gossypium arboreum TaxID=29729 RepID=A0ABR0PF90_GOSAR|nr:hypothetical protein PVK06_024772 [Gossypium arboreum]